MSYNPYMYVPAEFKEMVNKIARESKKSNAEIIRQLTKCCATGQDPILHFRSKGWLK